MIEKFLVLVCSRRAFKESCLKTHCKLDSLWLHVSSSAVFVEDKEDAIKDCRKFNNEQKSVVYFCHRISVY